MKRMKTTWFFLCFAIATLSAQEETLNCDLNFKEALFFLKGDENFARDSIKAVAYLKPCAAAGFANAQLLLGRLYLGQKTEERNLKAFDLIRKAAAQNNPTAIADLGMLYKYGYGCNLNFNKARRLFKKASEMGNDKATYSLGYLYLKGFGNISQNYTKAVKWFEKSDYDMAKYWLGICYYKGYGVEKNIQKANEYLNTQFVAQENKETTVSSTNTITNEIANTLTSEEETIVEDKIADDVLYGNWKGTLLQLDWSATTIEEKYDFAVAFKHDSINDINTSTLKFKGQHIQDEYVQVENTLYFQNTSLSIPHLSFKESIPSVLESEILSSDLTLKTINGTTYLTGVLENYVTDWNEPGAPLRFVLTKENTSTNSTIALSDEVLKALSEQEESFIKLYPNPFQDDLIISYQLEETSFVKVLFNDLYGNNAVVIEQGSTQQKGAYNYHYATTSLEKGTYIVSVFAGDKKYTRIIIKK